MIRIDSSISPYPIKHAPLKEKIRQLVDDEATLRDGAMDSGQLDTARSCVKADLRKTLSTSHAFLTGSIGILKSTFSGLELNLQDELIKMFGESKNEALRMNILNVLFQLEGGRLRFIRDSISKGVEDNNYQTCLSFLRLLSNDDKVKFLSTFWVNTDNGDDLDAASNVLLFMTENNPDLVLKGLLIGFSRRYKKCELQYRIESMFDLKRGSNTVLLFQILKKLKDKDIPLKYLMFVYKNTTDHETKIEIWNFIKEHLTKEPKDRGKIASTLIELTKAGKEHYSIQLLRWQALEHYNEIMGKDGTRFLCRTVRAKNRFIAYKAMSLLAISGSENERCALLDTIAQNANEGNVRPLMQVFWAVNYDERFEDIAYLLLKRSDIDFKSVCLSSNKTYLITPPGYAIHEESRTLYTSCTLDLNTILSCFDISKRLIPWALYAPDETVRLNAARLLDLIKVKELKTALSNLEIGYALKEAASIGIVNA